MKLVTKTLVAGLMLVAGVAVAAEATDPTVKARQELMDTLGMSMKTLGEMAGGKATFDAAAAEAAKAAIVAAAADIPAKFEAQANDPKSTAKPEIWTNWDDFLGDAKKLGDAAAAMDATSVEGIGAGMGAMGATCKDCHSEFRIPS